jgi:hypothetical protein
LSRRKWVEIRRSSLRETGLVWYKGLTNLTRCVHRLAQVGDRKLQLHIYSQPATQQYRMNFDRFWMKQKTLLKHWHRILPRCHRPKTCIPALKPILQRTCGLYFSALPSTSRYLRFKVLNTTTCNNHNCRRCRSLRSRRRSSSRSRSSSRRSLSRRSLSRRSGWRSSSSVLTTI